MRPLTWSRTAVALIALALVAAPIVRADDVGPSAEEFEDALPEGGGLSGREIYDRFLKNKFTRSVQEMRVVSRDPGGSHQTTAFTLSLEDLRDENDRPTDGVRAKMLVEVASPFDMRHTRYLMISKDPGPDDEFVYRPSQRLVRRADLRRTPLMGTDYTFDDIAYHDIEDAEYVRHPDEVVDGKSVYVVEANVKDTLDVEYHRTLSYLEKQHYVPLRVRYWDDFDVEVKELTAPASGLKQFGDVWVTTESTMKDMLQRTSSTLFVDDLTTEPRFPANLFSVARLTRGR